MKKSSSIIGIALVLGLLLTGFTGEDEQIPKSFPADSLDSLFQTLADKDLFSGTVAIGTQDSLMYHSAFGVANRTFNLPMETGFRFDIASLNKSMVAALVMIAQEERVLSINDHLVDLLKGVDYEGSFNDGITIHQLLTHTSGLPDYDAVDEDLASQNFRTFKRLHFTNPEYIDFISRLEMVEEPGTTFHYSNFGYHLICMILEDRYGMSFGELLEHKITGPLGMDFTYSTTSNKEIFDDTVEAYTYDEQGNRWVKNSFIDLTIGRRVFSTAADMYRWGTVISGSTIISDESINNLTTNYLNELHSDLSYGYGWVIYGPNESYSMGDLGIDKPYIIHGGSTEGFKSLLINIDEGEWIISILANSGNRTSEMDLAESILDILRTNNISE